VLTCCLSAGRCRNLMHTQANARSTEVPRRDVAYCATGWRFSSSV
jgi:hypothetical protein